MSKSGQNLAAAPTLNKIQKTKLQVAIAEKIANAASETVKITKFSARKRKQKSNGMTPKEARKERGRIFQAQKRERIRLHIESLEKSIKETRAANEEFKKNIVLMNVQVDELERRHLEKHRRKENNKNSTNQNQNSDSDTDTTTTPITTTCTTSKNRRYSNSRPAPIRRSEGPKFDATNVTPTSPMKLTTPPGGWFSTNATHSHTLLPSTSTPKSPTRKMSFSSPLTLSSLYKGAIEPFAFMEMSCTASSSSSSSSVSGKDSGVGSDNDNCMHKASKASPKIKEDPFQMVVDIVEDQLTPRFSPMSLSFRSPRSGGTMSDPFAWFMPNKQPPVPDYNYHDDSSCDSTPDSAFVDDECMLFTNSNTTSNVNSTASSSLSSSCSSSFSSSTSSPLVQLSSSTSLPSIPNITITNSPQLDADDGFHSAGLSTAALDDTDGDWPPIDFHLTSPLLLSTLASASKSQSLSTTSSSSSSSSISTSTMPSGCLATTALSPLLLSPPSAMALVW